MTSLNQIWTDAATVTTTMPRLSFYGRVSYADTEKCLATGSLIFYNKKKTKRKTNQQNILINMWSFFFECTVG